MSNDRHGVEELSQFGMEMIEQAGQIALTSYGKGDTALRFDEELITNIELQMMDYFQGELAARYPADQVFQNTLTDTEYHHGDKRYLWIFDPLDGVSNVQAGIPIWGVSLAMVDNFWPTFGIISLPATGDIFHAIAGQNAWWGKRELSVAKAGAINDESLLLTYSRFHQDYETSFPGKIRNLGCTAAHICYVAMGRADATIIANESFQGLAAARVIIEAAGGKIYKLDGSEFFLNEYLDGGRIGDHLLVACPDTVGQVLDTLSRIDLSQKDTCQQ